MAHFDQITEEQANAIKNGSALNLPNRPTEHGYTAAQVKAALANPIVGDTNSLLALLKGLITKLNEQLGNVDNTSDENKPISTAVQAALDGKVNNGNWVADISVGMNDNYVLSISLKDADGNTIGTAKEVDLPLEEMILSVTYADGKITLALKTGQSVTVDISDLVSGLVNEAAGTKTDGDLSYWNDGELDDSGIPKDKVAQIDGSYALMNVGTADNLKGRASSAVSADFTFRTSGGSADIGNPQATIKSIHGNTLVWNQIVGAIVPTSINDLTVSFVGGVLTVTGTASANTNIKLIDSDDFVNGHKYLVSGVPSGGSSSTYGAYWSNSGMFYSDAIQTYNSRGSFNIRVLSGTTVNISCIPQVFDLTKIYGSGNEPTTIAAFKAMFQLPYYAYDAGSLLHFNGTGLKTVGFNQWDEQIESGEYNAATGEKQASADYLRCVNKVRIFPNTVYYLKSPLALSAYYYDAAGSKIGTGSPTLNANRTFTTPSGAYYMTFAFNKNTYGGTTYKNDICINLSWSGYRNGEYEAYWASTLALPIATYFATGMKSAGTAYDELTAKKAIQRIGVVDLGTLDWENYLGTTGVFRANVTGIKGSTSATTKANIICVSYSTDTIQNVSSSIVNKTVAVNVDGSRIYIYDNSFTTDAAAFKSAVSGVMLAYEMATPVETDVDLALTYLVDDFGTEQLLPENDDEPTTSPFDGTIHYAMNAVDAIRNMPNKVYRATFNIKAYDDTRYYFSMVVGAIPSIDTANTKLVGVPAGVYRAIKGSNHEYADVEVDSSGQIYIGGTLDAFQAADSSVTTVKYF